MLTLSPNGGWIRTVKKNATLSPSDINSVPSKIWVQYRSIDVAIEMNILGCLLIILVGLGFLQSVSYTKTNPNPRQIICCGKKWLKCHFQPNFSWVGLALGWGVRRFHDNIFIPWYVFNPTDLGKSQAPYYSRSINRRGS